jgi:maleate isomerase
VQNAIIENFESLGVETVMERHLEDPGNYSFAEHGAAKVDALVREAAAAKPDAIVIHCTNFRGLPGAVGIAVETGIPVLDSVAVALWGAIRAAGRSPAMIQGAGRLFSL